MENQFKSKIKKNQANGPKASRKNSSAQRSDTLGSDFFRGGPDSREKASGEIAQAFDNYKIKEEKDDDNSSIGY